MLNEGGGFIGFESDAAVSKKVSFLEMLSLRGGGGGGGAMPCGSVRCVTIPRPMDACLL